MRQQGQASLPVGPGQAPTVSAVLRRRAEHPGGFGGQAPSGGPVASLTLPLVQVELRFEKDSYQF